MQQAIERLDMSFSHHGGQHYIHCSYNGSKATKRKLTVPPHLAELNRGAFDRNKLLSSEPQALQEKGRQIFTLLIDDDQKEWYIPVILENAYL